ncbi:hypothetical protein R1flu_021436 [Riccia fluitans]|uniref:Enoyl reductase (ER) domain-containing protein n=1 Tax=Riccia fluitans TaxID=41844 RepID=A0ABD1ZPD3_9MARC
MYRAIVQRGYNADHPESTLELVEKPIPAAAPGRVVVHITLRPINPTDKVNLATGKTARQYSYPVTIGAEGFGVVHSVGEGVSSVKPGQRVVPLFWEEGWVGNGSWQEYVSIREEMVVPIPDTISDETAAQFVVNPWAVIGMFHDLAVPKGEYVLQTAAGSVIGRQIIQYAKRNGIKTINLIRRPEQKTELEALGADEVICYTSEDVVTRVKEITENKLAYCALDAVGGDLTKKVTASVRRGGQVLMYGVLSSPDATVRIRDLFREITVKGWILSNYWVSNEKRKMYIDQALECLGTKVMEPQTGQKFDLAEFKEAIKKSEEAGKGGKVLLRHDKSLSRWSCCPSNQTLHVVRSKNKELVIICASPVSTESFVTGRRLQVPIPAAAPGRVVVHITLRPINPTDLVTIRSGITARYYSHPVTIGSEGFGIVHSVGEGVSLVRPGQRVVPLMWEEGRVGNGSWQEYVSLREDMVVPVPDTISDETAAQFVINPWAIIGMLHDLAVPKGEYLLQTAAGSVLGRQLIQLAKHKGIKTINLIRRPEQRAELEALGADEVICYTSEDVVSRVKEITGKKLAYGALDAVGGDLTKAVTASVRRGGQVFIYGVLSSRDATVRITDLFREITVRGWILSNYWWSEEKRNMYIEEALEYLGDKVMEPQTGEKFDLAEFKEAITKSEEVGKRGKVLLVS